MNFKEVVQQEELDFIKDAQVLMAKETENLELNRNIVNEGVDYLFKNKEYGKYYIVELENKIIACLLTTYEWSDWRNGVCLWIQSVYVLPEFRNRGVFKFMYSELKNYVNINDSITGLRLYVDKTNTKAQAVYEKVGMSKEHYELYEWLK
jgi:predicted GNAT family acetyltransferase